MRIESVSSTYTIFAYLQGNEHWEGFPRRRKVIAQTPTLREFFKGFLLIVYMWLGEVPGSACRGQKRALGPQELELEMVKSHCVGANQVLWKISQCS